MRHEGPFQFGNDGPWHYASVKAGKGGHPIGYCTEACSHALPEQAHEHYRQYVLDHLTEQSIGEDTQHRCAVDGCEAWTQAGLQEPDGYHFELLCDEHRNRDTYEAEFYPADGPIRESWVQ